MKSGNHDTALIYWKVSHFFLISLIFGLYIHHKIFKKMHDIINYVPNEIEGIISPFKSMLVTQIVFIAKYAIFTDFYQILAYFRLKTFLTCIFWKRRLSTFFLNRSYNFIIKCAQEPSFEQSIPDYYIRRMVLLEKWL